MATHPVGARVSTFRTPSFLLLLAAVPVVAGIARLVELAGGGEVTAANARFFAHPLPVVIHLLAVIPYTLLGALQFSAGIRRRHPAWHRVAGRIVAPCGLVAALTGLWMTLVYPWPEGDGPVLYVTRLIVGLAMAGCLVLGVDAVVRRHDLEAHGAWMIRAYALGLGAGTQVLTHLPWFIFVGGMPIPEAPRALFMAGAWVINAGVAEAIIRSRRPRAIHARSEA